MTDGLGKIYDLIEKAVSSVLPDAKEVVNYYISPDSKASLEEICESALKKYIDSIITNHFEYYTGKKYIKISMDMSCIDDSLREIDQYKTSLKGKLEILVLLVILKLNISIKIL